MHPIMTSTFYFPTGYFGGWCMWQAGKEKLASTNTSVCDDAENQVVWWSLSRQGKAVACLPGTVLTADAELESVAPVFLVYCMS
jgi:hypothetical protein